MNEFNEHMSQFLNAYIVCALWSTTDEHGDPLDDNYTKESIDADSLMLMTIDCYNFYRGNYTLWFGEIDSGQAGHDFWLTRNGHGTGFWDRDIKSADLLSKRAGAYGEVHLYAGDDKLLYI